MTKYNVRRLVHIQNELENGRAPLEGDMLWLIGMVTQIDRNRMFLVTCLVLCLIISSVTGFCNWINYLR